MNNKTKRMDAAKQTLQVYEQGFYEVGGMRVDVSELHKNSMGNTMLYTPEMIEQIEQKKIEELKVRGGDNKNAKYILSPLPVVTALSKYKKDSMGILNFASAKNAGGGFLNGALAQEESLAMCSNLYITQIKNREYYDKNRACKSLLYTDYMIYSKDVVFIREDAESLWKEPIVASVLTAPAVNMGQYLRREDASIPLAEKVMKDRMRKVLTVFAEQKNENIILGAYGCGVFRNDPKTVAKFFVELLKDEGYGQYFKEVIFAVYDSSKNKNVYNEFERALSPFLTNE